MRYFDMRDIYIYMYMRYFDMRYIYEIFRYEREIYIYVHEIFDMRYIYEIFRYERDIYIYVIFRSLPVSGMYNIGDKSRPTVT